MFRSTLLLCLCAVAALSTARAQTLNARDGSTEPPRLLLVQAMWGMERLPAKEDEWPLEEKLRRIKEAGFDAADFTVPFVMGKEEQIASLLARHRLKIGLQTFPNSVEELRRAWPTVKRMNSPYLDVHVGNYYVPESEATALLGAMAAEAKEQGVALMVQTHRGRVTQDLFRTVNYTKAIPDLRFCLDLSHYFVAGEIGGKLSPPADELFDALLRRAAMLDGRISNGEQVQIDIGPAGETPQAKNFAALWKRAMLYWLKSARPGDLFVFRVELGPPGYSILDLNGREISDRWAQARVLGALAERIWNEAVAEAGVGARHASGIPGK